MSLTQERQKGIGTLFAPGLLKTSNKPVLIGTWKAAHWAIRFYETARLFCWFRKKKKK